MNNNFQMNCSFYYPMLHNLILNQQNFDYIQQIPYYPSSPNLFFPSLNQYYPVISNNNFFLNNTVGINFYEGQQNFENINRLINEQSIYHTNDSIIKLLYYEQLKREKQIENCMRYENVNYLDFNDFNYLGAKRYRSDYNVPSSCNQISQNNDCIITEKKKNPNKTQTSQINEKEEEKIKKLSIFQNYEKEIEIKSTDKSSNKSETQNEIFLNEDSSKKSKKKKSQDEGQIISELSIVINNSEDLKEKKKKELTGRSQKTFGKIKTLKETRISSNITKTNNLNKTKCLFHGNNYRKTSSIDDFMKYNFDFDEERNIRKISKITKDDCVDLNGFKDIKSLGNNEVIKIKEKWLNSRFNGNYHKLKEEINEIQKMLKFKNKETITEEKYLNLLALNNYNFEQIKIIKDN